MDVVGPVLLQEVAGPVEEADARAAMMSVTLIGALVTAHMDPDGAARACQRLAEGLA